jgi:hypothetical protein
MYAGTSEGRCVQVTMHKHTARRHMNYTTRGIACGEGIEEAAAREHVPRRHHTNRCRLVRSARSVVSLKIQRCVVRELRLG